MNTANAIVHAADPWAIFVTSVGTFYEIKDWIGREPEEEEG